MKARGALHSLRVPVSLTALAPLVARQDELIPRWRAAHREVLGEDGRLREGEFRTVLALELERLADARTAASEARILAALRSTASCLARRGVPLAELMTAVATASEAAQGTLPPEEARAVAPALVALEHLRLRVYPSVYLEQVEAGTCDRPLVTLGPPERTPTPQRYGLVGDSDAMRSLLVRVEAAARGPRKILVTGEAGTGKELVARAIHAAAGRERSKFVAVHCASVPLQLLESELFGSARGVSDGTGGEYLGLLRSANGGTLFLDELTEMHADTQATLLRVLEARAVRPVGGAREVPVDVQVIASTGRDPRAAIASGRLREDLYYRLQELHIHVAPLRERRGDIPALVEHFLTTFCSRRCGCVWGIEPEALDALAESPWPGNVRQLKNAVEQAVTGGTSGWIGLADLPAELTAGRRVGGPRAEAPAANGAPPARAAPELPTLAEAEAQLVRATLRRLGGNKVQAAKALGISRHKLYDLLKRIGET